MTAPSDIALYDGFGRWLHQRGLARYTPAGAAPDTLPLFKVGTLGHAPSHAIGCLIYNRSTERGGRGTPDVWVQLRYRADTLPAVTELASDVSDALDDHSHLALTSEVHVLLAKRVVVTPPNEDANGRWERCDSYRLTLNP